MIVFSVSLDCDLYFSVPVVLYEIVYIIVVRAAAGIRAHAAANVLSQLRHKSILRRRGRPSLTRRAPHTGPRNDGTRPYSLFWSMICAEKQIWMEKAWGWTKVCVDLC